MNTPFSGGVGVGFLVAGKLIVSGLNGMIRLQRYTLFIAWLLALSADAQELDRDDASLSELEARQEYIEGMLDELPRTSMRSGTGSIGYRSRGFPDEEREVKIEIRLEQPERIDEIVLVPTIWRSMNDGFQADGFPLSFRVQAGMDGDSEGQTVASFTEADGLLPRVAPLIIPIEGLEASWIRIETQRLSKRAIDDRAVLQLSEILVFSGAANVALRQKVIASSSPNAASFPWHKNYLVDGSMPYVINSAKGGRSVAYISAIVEKPSIVVDLGKEYPLSGLQLYRVEQGDTVPQAYSSTYGIPQHLRVWGSMTEGFEDATLLHELFNRGRMEYGPIIMKRFSEVPVRYVRFEANNEMDPTLNLIEQGRLGFAEIEIYSKGENVALGKTATANHKPNSPGRSLVALTDGMNLYGEILPLQVWLGGLARRHELETELPLVVGELGHRYDRQEFRLSLMTWIAAIFAVGIGLIFLVERNLRLNQADQIRRRIAANLHDELGADLHAIGLLGDHAINVVDVRAELIDTAQRIRSLTEETSATARHCTNMLESGVDNGNFITEMRRSAFRLMDDTDYDLQVEGVKFLTRLKPRRRIDLLLFHKECLINTIRHSESSWVRTSLTASSKVILLQVSDNGVGLAGKIPPSLQRRAKLMRGEVTCNETENGSSQITLSLRLNRLRWFL